MTPPLPIAPGPGTPTFQNAFAQATVTYLQYLSGLNSLPNTVVNGSFETFTGATPNTPDNWAFTAYTGTGTVDQSDEAADGRNSFKITVPASGGGGYLQSDILLPWNSAEDFWASWYYMVDNAATANRVDVVWFNRLGVQIEVQNLWQATSGQPTSWQQNVGHIPAYEGTSGSTVIPSDAEFYAIRITGGTTVNTQTGHVWYDRIKTGFQPTMRNVNIRTNTNGSLIIPDNVFFVNAKLFGRRGGSSSFFGGYCEKTFRVTPGDTVSYTATQLGSGPTLTHSPSSTSMAAGDQNGSDGGASGGDINETGASLFIEEVIFISY